MSAGRLNTAVVAVNFVAVPVVAWGLIRLLGEDEAVLGASGWSC